MIRHHCGAENAAQAKFCNGCGEAIAPATPAAADVRPVFCSACGTPNKAGQKFCNKCGGALAAAAASAAAASTTSSTAPPAIAPAAAKSSRTPVIAGVAALVVAIIAGAGWYFTQSGEQVASEQVQAEVAAANAALAAGQAQELTPEQQIQAILAASPKTTATNADDVRAQIAVQQAQMEMLNKLAREAQAKGQPLDAATTAALMSALQNGTNLSSQDMKASTSRAAQNAANAKINELTGGALPNGVAGLNAQDLSGSASRAAQQAAANKLNQAAAGALAGVLPQGGGNVLQQATQSGSKSSSQSASQSVTDMATRSAKQAVANSVDDAVRKGMGGAGRNVATGALEGEARQLAGNMQDKAVNTALDAAKNLFAGQAAQATKASATASRSGNKSTASSAQQACASSSNFIARSMCEAKECQKPEYVKSAFCVDLNARNQSLQQNNY